MNYIIRGMKQEEYALLSNFLYEAIYIPKGVEPPPRSVISLPELKDSEPGFRQRAQKALIHALSEDADTAFLKDSPELKEFVEQLDAYRH